MASLSLKTKFGLLLGLVVLGNLITLLFVILQINGFSQRFSDFHVAGVGLETRTLAVARDTNYVSRLTRSIMLGDSLEKNLDGLDKTIESVQKSFDDMGGALREIDDPDIQKRMENLVNGARQDTLAFMNDARDRMRKLREVNRSPEALAGAWADYHKAATPLANKARESFKALSDETTIYLSTTRTATSESLLTMKQFLTVLLLSGAAIVVALGVFLARRIIIPLRQAMQLADRVASGDLTTRIEVHTRDETGHLLRALHTMQEQLKGMVGRLSKVATTVSDTSRALSLSVVAVSDHAHHQAESTNEMAAAIEEMAQSISQMAQNAEASTQGANQSLHIADEGKAEVDHAAGELRSIAESVNQASALVTTLNQRSDEISKIVGVIKEIADQTNLLALNAAIEAARAGEQGRGFAVVADEVRKLAERSAQSTQEISHMLDGVQQATYQVVTQMGDSNARVERGVTRAESARTYMDRIGGSTNVLATTIDNMSSSLREQSLASNLVAQSVEQISEMTDQTTAELDRIQHAATELDNVAHTLRDAISVFRL